MGQIRRWYWWRKIVDKKELYKKFNVLFDSYRICKYLTDDVQDLPQDFDVWMEFRIKVESIVDLLPEKEKEIIQERYMKDDYAFDKDVYEKLKISNKTYDKRKFIALKKISSLI